MALKDGGLADVRLWSAMYTIIGTLVDFSMFG
jgi:hypothetical protein